MNPARDESNRESRKVISPEELDIEESENVVTLDDGRFVIGASGRPSVPDEPTEVTTRNPNDDTTPAIEPSSSESPPSTNAQPAIDSGSSGEPPSNETESSSTSNTNQSSPTDGQQIDSRDVRQWLEEDLEDVASRYGFHIAAKAEDSISHQQMFSDDVGTVFDSLIMWYAQQVDKRTPVEDVIGILLMESNIRVRYSPRCLRGLLATHDLSPDDSISDLFRAIQDANGVVFPPDID